MRCDMAKGADSGGVLQVSRCHCETGRKRHRIPDSVRIPFENSQTTVAQGIVVDDDTEEDDTEDDTEDEVMEDNQVSDGEGHDEDEGEEDDDDDDNDDDDDDNDDDNDSDDNDNEIDDDSDGEMASPSHHPAHPLLLPPPVDAHPPFIPTQAPPMQVGAVQAGIMWIDNHDDSDTDEASEPSTDATQPTLHDSDSESDEEGVPQIATWRLNLTALSTVYNFYAVAYKDKIHISRPRSCVTNALPTKPDLVLRPGASHMGIVVGGYLDQSFPHQVNHLIVGDFGDEEILLLAYDDGDVIGFYTRHIEAELLRLEYDNDMGPPRVPKPFFHENVGKSAWGLAVHKQSRMIAVGANTHNVCVFIFALTGELYQHVEEADHVEFFRTLIKNEKGALGNRVISGGEKDNAKFVSGLERAVRRRDANWRIVLETGSAGDNIPNVAFGSDADGDAEKVLAVDVKGSLWIMDIWKMNKCPHIRIDGLHSIRTPSDRQRLFQWPRELPRAWGVLVLPESSFLPTKSYDDSLGLKPREAKYVSNDKIGRWVDISVGINHVKNNSTTHPWVRSGNTNRFAINPHLQRRQRWENWYDFNTSQGPSWSVTIDEQGQQRMPLVPSKGKYQAGRKEADGKLILGDGSSIMRTYELDIELRSFEEDGVGIMFERAIEQDRPANTVLRPMRWSHERLSNLIHVPELSLVVAGSLCGRVALVTLTRPVYENSPFKRGFKIEAILPTKKDEDSQLRPICPLLGVAIAPMPCSGKLGKADEPLGTRGYRLMLHYYDLRVLSYEVYRNMTTEELSVV
ncbi:hypothetical protein F5X96DRAFT_623087 [Biscogniauxia mediterranea]|nr:hypothetical protein F5X96DRAFT_623087 [Biscogniauxia mediterranea]